MQHSHLKFPLSHLPSIPPFSLLEVLHNMGTPKKKINKKPLLSQAKAFRFP